MIERRKPPEQIEAEPWKDYVPKPDKGAREPLIAPGGWLALIGLISTILIYYFAGQYFGPIVRSAVRATTGL